MSRSRSFVWSWGAGTRGQLGNAAFADSLEPVQLSKFDGSEATSPPSWHGVVNDMACGGAHAVAILSVSNDGEEQAQVMSWGNGESGALGHGRTDDLSVPKVVEFFSGIRVSSVAAGWSHTAFVTLSGALYTCGSGSFGQLGHGDFGERLIPFQVEFVSSKRVVMAACGMRHTLVLTNDRGTPEQTSVFSFGAGRRGQLGLSRLDLLQQEHSSSRKLVKVSVPKEVAELTRRANDEVVELVAANGDHSAAITSYGHLFVWGRGFCGDSDYFEPRQVKNQQAPSVPSFKSHFCGWNHFTYVSLGWNHGLALGIDGVLWAWGSNQRGQVGTSDGEKPVSVSFSSETCAQDGDCIDQQWPKMVRVHGITGKCLISSAGSEHSAALCDSGEVRVWGWGEHGQLGLGDTSDVPLPQVVSLPGDFHKDSLTWRVFCGSGFTFVVANQND
ncbi:hypothetical protein R1flu_021916 [Riccia fluitans]|uniref:RCC1-like domain-containing protein n=1 Tax=Riccia fluitans TaxID=41844 RepID=A0ABD1ZQQ0_9MARC